MIKAEKLSIEGEGEGKRRGPSHQDNENYESTETQRALKVH